MTNLVGTTVAARNLISGNFGSGVFVHAPSDSARPVRNRIQGNFIGTKIDGTTALATVSPAYFTSPRATTTSAARTRAPGTQFSSTRGTASTLTWMPASEQHPRQLDRQEQRRCRGAQQPRARHQPGRGRPLNDAGDTDTARTTSRLPESTAPAQAGDDDVFGVLHSNPNEAFRVEVFASRTATGPKTHARYIGSVDVTTNASGVTVIKSPGESDRAVFPVHVDVDVEHAIATTNRHGR